MNKGLLVTITILGCVVAMVSPAAAQQQITPPPPLPTNSTTVTVNNGPGEQLDPHVSGDFISYSDGNTTQRTRYYRFSTAADQAIPAPAGASDILSDVSGARITFTRSLGGCNSIFVFDIANASTSEVAPQPCSQRFASRVGNTTIAFTDLASQQIFATDLSSGVVTQLSSQPGTAQSPSVASSGNAVVWEQCASLISNCDIMKAVRNGGLWGAAQPVATAPTPETNPDTDDTWIVYEATRSSGDRHIYFQPLGGGTETELQIAGMQSAPHISSGVIVFETRASVLAPGDILAYVIATNTLYQLTFTPTVDEHLTDISVLPNGDVRIAWGANDGLVGDGNIYATTFTPAGGVHYQICPLYDGQVAKKAGTAYPIKLQLCDASGNNLSSPNVVLHAVSVTRTSNDAPGPLDDTGNANPDLDFRYDASLQGYVFNLNLKCQAAQCFTTGTYNLNFKAGEDQAAHSAPFAVK